MIQIKSGFAVIPQYTPPDKGEELPMSNDALLAWFYIGVVVVAVVPWIIWYRIVGM